MSKQEGLKEKYNVSRVDGDPIDFCFVLEPARDPLAFEALSLYAVLAEADGYQRLSDDLYMALQKIKRRD